MNALLQNPWIAEQIDLALAPYAGRLPASELAWMREQLAETLANDEHAAAVLRAAAPRVVEESGEVARGQGRTAEDAARERGEAGKKKAR